MKVSEINQMFSFQRPCWMEHFDKTTKKRAARNCFFEIEFSENVVSSFYALRLWNVRKRVDMKIVEWFDKRVKWWNSLKFNCSEFCNLENGKLRTVRSSSRKEVPFNKHFRWICFFFDLANLTVYESYTTFFYPSDVSDGIKLRYTYTDSRVMSCKSADLDESFISLQN